MTSDLLGKRLGNGGFALSAWSTFADREVVEALARSPFDCVTIDMQHGSHDLASARAAIAVTALAGKPAAVRLGLAAWGEAARVLDAGAAMVIAPMIDSADLARDLVAATKYPPVGARSWGPQAAMALCGRGRHDYLAHANDFSLALGMIETEAALAALDDILAVEGLDGVFVGPSDLSISLAEGRAIDPGAAEVDAAFALVAGRAAAHGKLAGAFTTTPAMAARVRRLGYRFVALGADGGYLGAGVGVLLDEFRQID